MLLIIVMFTHFIYLNNNSYVYTHWQWIYHLGWLESGLLCDAKYNFVMCCYCHVVRVLFLLYYLLLCCLLTLFTATGSSSYVYTCTGDGYVTWYGLNQVCCAMQSIFLSCVIIMWKLCCLFLYYLLMCC
jgi:hypothetical protein